MVQSTVRNKLLLLLFSLFFITVGIGVKGAEADQDPYSNVKSAFYQDIVYVNNPDSLSVLVNKNYRLPNDYEPTDLVLLDVPLYNSDSSNEANYLRQEAANALKDLFSEAKVAGYDLVARSGYRSYETQVMLYNNYVARDGMESADTYSARPGHSEHQTGLTIDITSSSVNHGLTESFGETEEGQWVAENAHRFGFIIRYPQERTLETGYQYEPWHLRYVGVDSATQIYQQDWILEDFIIEKGLLK